MSKIKANFALGTGYAVVLGLVIISTVEAYRLQSSLSEREVAVYKRHIAREKALLQVRDSVWVLASHARDYMLSGDAGRFRLQLKELNEQCSTELAHLPPDIQQRFEFFAAGLDRLARFNPANGGLALERLEEFKPRRMALLAALSRVSGETRAELSSAEKGFTNSQRAILWQLLVVLGVCLFAGFSTAWAALRYLRKAQREKAQHSDELACLSARLLEVQEEERRVLAGELHDEVGQTLTALGMELAPALAGTENLDARERLRRARRLLERAITTVRDISSMLRPMMLDDLGLEAALGWLVSEFSTRSGIRADFVADEPMLELPDEIKTCVYRVAQEALNNCEKYSHASRVRLLLRYSEERLVLEVSDDGVGFHLTRGSARGGGTGLLGIRERVARLGGSSMLDAAPGNGARLIVVLPLARFALHLSDEVLVQ